MSSDQQVEGRFQMLEGRIETIEKDLREQGKEVKVRLDGITKTLKHITTFLKIPPVDSRETEATSVESEHQEVEGIPVEDQGIEFGTAPNVPTAQNTPPPIGLIRIDVTPPAAHEIPASVVQPSSSVTPTERTREIPPSIVPPRSDVSLPAGGAEREGLPCPEYVSLELHLPIKDSTNLEFVEKILRGRHDAISDLAFKLSRKQIEENHLRGTFTRLLMDQIFSPKFAKEVVFIQRGGTKKRAIRESPLYSVVVGALNLKFPEPAEENTLATRGELQTTNKHPHLQTKSFPCDDEIRSWLKSKKN